MKVITIPGANFTIAEEQDEYTTLPVKVGSVDVELQDGVYEAIPTLTSAWRPTVDELLLLYRGGYVELCVLGAKHPPVMLNVKPTS